MTKLVKDTIYDEIIPISTTELALFKQNKQIKLTFPLAEKKKMVKNFTILARLNKAEHILVKVISSKCYRSNIVCNLQAA